MKKNAEYQQTYRDALNEAGLKEIRGLLYPPGEHEKIKAEVRRNNGTHKVKR